MYTLTYKKQYKSNAAQLDRNMFNKHLFIQHLLTGGLNENKWLSYTPMLSDPFMIPEFNRLLNLTLFTKRTQFDTKLSSLFISQNNSLAATILVLTRCIIACIIPRCRDKRYRFVLQLMCMLQVSTATPLGSFKKNIFNVKIPSVNNQKRVRYTE